MLLRDAVADYVTGRARRGEINAASAKQIAWRLSLLRRVAPVDAQVADLDARLLEAYLETVGTQAAATRRGYLSALHGFCEWAVDQELLERDPSRKLAHVREPRRPPRALSAAQIARLRLILPDRRARVIVALMGRLGLRCVEVSRLTVADWDRYDGTIRVRGKGDHERILPVPSDVEAELAAHLHDAAPTSPVVGGTPSWISRQVSAWMDDAGLKTAAYDGISAHALRHSAASDLLDHCGNVRTVQDFLGHVSLATTERYLRRADLKAMRAALEA